jgi:hypothetical protein
MANDAGAQISAPQPRPSRLGLRAILVYDFADRVSGWLICATIVFAPWAFGTTQPWSIWTMNFAGYALGAMLLTKLFIRLTLGHRPARWRDPEEGAHVATIALATLTFAILVYCFIGALNARAIYDPWRMDFAFRDKFLSWLPHSYDRDATFHALANFLALAGGFWATHDWLLGRSHGEIRAARSDAAALSRTRFVPARLRTLLLVLSINATVLALEAIAQRLSGSNQLLWLVTPRINKDAASQFGPFAYRGNGAQYFNLLWPITLGFWWTLRREARARRFSEIRRGEWRSHLLLPCVVLVATCPILSASRGGAAVAIGGLIIATIIILMGLRQRHPTVKLAVLLFFATALGTGLWLGWEKLSERVNSTGADYLARESTYATARQIAQDYPLFGTGPGTFASVFHLYRNSTEEYWPAQLHNDWLETRITFGWLGSALIAVAFAIVILRWWLPGRIHGGWRMTSLLWLALAGCLAHARFDFPLQVYSILHLFLLECAILFTISRQPRIAEVAA